VAEFNKDGLRNVFLVAIGVCLVCSIVVSTAAVVLKPQQLVNQELDRKKNILRAAGVLPARADTDAQGRGVDELFADFAGYAVDLDSGEILDDVDAAALDPIKAAKKPELSRARSTFVAMLRVALISLLFPSAVTACGALCLVTLPSKAI